MTPLTRLWLFSSQKENWFKERKTTVAGYRVKAGFFSKGQNYSSSRKLRRRSSISSFTWAGTFCRPIGVTFATKSSIVTFSILSFWTCSKIFRLLYLWGTLVINLYKLLSYQLSSQIHSIFVEGTVSIGQFHRNLVIWHLAGFYNRVQSLDYYRPLSKCNRNLFHYSFSGILCETAVKESLFSLKNISGFFEWLDWMTLDGFYFW